MEALTSFATGTQAEVRLSAKGCATSGTVPACYSGAGFDDGLRAEARGNRTAPYSSWTLP